MTCRLICFSALFFLSIQFTWSLNIPEGWSSVSFAITTPSSPSQVFGSNITNVQQIVGLESQRFTFWDTSSMQSSDVLTELFPDRGYFIKASSAFQLLETATFSLSDYPLTTGFQLIPLKSAETLTSLTNPMNPFASRIYAVVGLYASRWYMHYPGEGLSYTSAVSQVLQTTSVSSLTEITPGFAYYIGLRPLLKRVRVQSVRLSSKMVQGAKLNFGALDGLDSSNSLFLANSSFSLGSSLSNTQGDWSGDVFVPYESQTLISQWQAVNGASAVGSTDLVSGEFMYSTYRLDTTTSFETIPRINFSPLTNLISFQRLTDNENSQGSLAANFISQLVEQESGGFSDFNTSPLQLFEASTSSLNPLHNLSFRGRNSSSLESTVVNLAHQLSNGLIQRKFDNSNQLIDDLSDFSTLNSNPIQVESQQFLNSLRQGLDSYNDLSSVMVELNNSNGPNLRLISRNVSSDAFLTLNALQVGNQSAVIENIDNEIADLVPNNGEAQFIFDEYPEFLRIPLGSYNAVNEVSGKMGLSLVRRNSSGPPFAHVTATQFTIALKDRDSLCPFSSSNTEKYQMCVQIADNSAVQFRYQYLHNGFPLTGSGTNMNSLDSGDTHLSKAGFIEIPILAYVQKAGNISEKFRDVDLELRISLEGFKFALNGFSDREFHDFRIGNIRINSP